MDEIKNLIDEAIVNRLQSISSYDEESKEQSRAMEEVAKLHRLRIEELKVENEHAEKVEQAELERDKYFLESNVKDDERHVKEREFKERHWDRWINVGVIAATSIGSWLFYDALDRRGYRYDAEGIMRQPHIRSLITRVLPKK